MSESLADEFARQLAEDADDNDFGCWATNNRDRILAALRVAEIVAAPTPEEADRIGSYADWKGECVEDEGWEADVGRAACRFILSLANEAGERERQG